VIMTGERQHLSSKLDRVRPIARIPENPERGRSNDIPATAIGRDDFGHAKRGAAVRAVWLISGNRDGDHRDTRNHRFLDAVEASMGDEDGAVRKQQGLRHVPLQAHVGGHRAEARGVLVGANGYHEIYRFLGEPLDNGLENPWGGVEHGAQTGQNCRLIGYSAVDFPDVRGPIQAGTRSALLRSRGARTACYSASVRHRHPKPEA
jgi:hypothetical protein